jgi:hypothetical protein
MDPVLAVCVREPPSCSKGGGSKGGCVSQCMKAGDQKVCVRVSQVYAGGGSGVCEYEAYVVVYGYAHTHTHTHTYTQPHTHTHLNNCRPPAPPCALQRWTDGPAASPSMSRWRTPGAVVEEGSMRVYVNEGSMGWVYEVSLRGL